MVFAQRGCLSSDPSQRKPLLLASSAGFGTHRSQKHAGNVVPRIILRPHVGRNGVLIVRGLAIARSSVTCVFLLLHFLLTLLVFSSLSRLVLLRLLSHSTVT